jgi:hypothetical protein
VAIREVSRKEKLTFSSTEVTRVIDVYPWSGRLVVARALLGSVTLIGRRLVRILPARDPHMPWAFCQDVSIEAIEDDYMIEPSSGAPPLTRSGDYSLLARLTCTYKNYDSEEQDQDQQSQSNDSQQEIEIASLAWDFSGQSLTLPNRFLIYEDDPAGGAGGNETPLGSEVAATYSIPKFDVLLARHYVIQKPVNAILKTLGRVNTSTFRIGFDQYPAATLRFDSAQITQKLTSQGMKYFDVTYRFAVMPVWDRYMASFNNPQGPGFVGWNRVFDPRKAIWRPVVWNDNRGRGIYLLDEDVTMTLGGRVVKGFNLLFHPRAT